jgi:dihydrofolate synthase/folylpolyglutamate synthase
MSDFDEEYGDNEDKNVNESGLTHDPELNDDSLYQREADKVYKELLGRIGEANPQPRLAATRRVVELLGDPQRAYPIIHITGTNGKTSTSRITESILRAYDLRTGLLTSPHLVRVNERIMIDGEPISNEAFIANYRDIEPYLTMVDAELTAAGEPELSFFEAFTALGFASFADAPVDVAIIEVGLGGEWDSTNVGDGVVAVFTPISLDHTARLGNTVEEIAKTKAGIIKPIAAVVTALQDPAALAEIERAAGIMEATVNVQGAGFSLLSNTVAVGGQVISVKGLAGTYNDLFLPLFGDHQAQNAAVAIAAVESFLGNGTQALVGDVLAEGLATATSPGRLQVIGIEPTVIVDAAHNPDGAASLAKAIASYFTFDEVAIVLGVLADKDAAGIISALAATAEVFLVTASSSDRAIPVDDLLETVREVAPDTAVEDYDTLAEALDAARSWASKADKRGVIVTGSITLIGDAMVIAEKAGWKR